MLKHGRRPSISTKMLPFGFWRLSPLPYKLQGGRPERSGLLFLKLLLVFGCTRKNAQKGMFFRYSATPPHPTAKPSWGWLRIGVRKPRLILVGISSSTARGNTRFGGLTFRSPRGRFGHLRCLLAPPGCRVELGRRWAGLGWSKSTSIDRGRARRTGTR